MFKHFTRKNFLAEHQRIRLEDEACTVKFADEELSTFEKLHQKFLRLEPF